MKRKQSSAAFTLIELLTAMLILMIISLMMVQIFADADKVWFLGSGRANNCAAGRAAMNLMAHDLQYAAADSILTFVVAPDRKGSQCYGFANDEACFVSLQNDSQDGNRTAREIFYYVTNLTGRAGNLMRGYFSDTILTDYANHCYSNRNWHATRPANARPIVEHVTGLSFFVPTNQNAYCGAAYGSSNVYRYATSPYMTSPLYLSNSLPEYIDVYLEVIDDLAYDQLTQMEVQGMSDTDKRAFVERNARRYTTRVHFQNRIGYKKR